MNFWYFENSWHSSSENNRSYSRKSANEQVYLYSRDQIIMKMKMKTDHIDTTQTDLQSRTKYLAMAEKSSKTGQEKDVWYLLLCVF